MVTIVRLLQAFRARESVIIECPLNGLFHDLVTVIITAQMAIRELDDDDDDDKRPNILWKC